MSYKIVFILVGLSATLLAGCTAQILSNERIASNTAGIIGVPPEDVTIDNRRTEITNTYYIARTKDGKELSCMINGGNILTFGMVNAPRCAKKGEPIQATSFHH